MLLSMQAKDPLTKELDQKARHSCTYCAMSKICIPLGVSQEDLHRLEQLIENSKSLQTGAHIYNQGDKLQKIYAVKSGAVKSVSLDDQGHEHVVGFHLPGELVGLDGIYPEQHISTTIALDTTVMCEMEYSQLESLCAEIPSLQHQMFRLLSRDIYDSHLSKSEASDQTAEQKLANFLHNLSIRYEARGFSATKFPLTMPRQDIANYLNLAPETVSRLLKRFKDRGYLLIESKQLNILDIEALEAINECSADTA